MVVGIGMKAHDLFNYEKALRTRETLSDIRTGEFVRFSAGIDLDDTFTFITQGGGEIIEFVLNGVSFSVEKKEKEI